MCYCINGTQGYFICYLASKQFIKQGLTLRKNERLKSRKLLEQLFREGGTFFIHPLKLYYQREPGLSSDIKLQAGFGVSARTFKKAVDRNRIKRLMREAYRLQKSSLQNAVVSSNNKLAVFFLYVGKDIPEFGLMKDKIKAALEKLEKNLFQGAG